MTTFPAATPPTYTLSDLVKAVIQNNPGLLASVRSREAAVAAMATAGALPNPRIELSTGNNQPRLPSAIGGTTSNMAVSQFVENPRSRSARMEAARQGERSSVEQIGMARNELVAQVRIKAFEYLLRQEQARASSDALKLLEQIRERVKLRVETGEAARYEIIKADAEIVNARQKFQTATLQIDQAALAINRLAAGALPAQWTLNANLSDSVEVTPLEELRQQALDKNPELKSLQAELLKRQARIAEAKSSRFPGVELRVNQQRDAEIRGTSLSAVIQIPLLDQRRGPVGEAVAETERARTLLEGRRAELQQQLLLGLKAMEVARVRVNALSTGAMREAEAALRVAEAAYRFGERGILDVLDAQRVLRNVRDDLLDARFQVQAAGVDLDFLSGRFALLYSEELDTQLIPAQN